MALNLEAVHKVFASMRTGLSARKACKLHRVNRDSFYQALDADELLADQYTRARSAMCDALADRALDRVVACKNEPNAIAKMRIELDALKWLLSKLSPRRYGDKLGLVGADGVSDLNLPFDERIARVTALLDAARTRQARSVASDDSGEPGGVVAALSGSADESASDKS